jgi:hypothetical protein
MGKEKTRKHKQADVEMWKLNDKNLEKKKARESLRWMYETARGAHCSYLEKLGVHECDAASHDEHLSQEMLTRKYMYDFIVMVMNLDHDFGFAMRPYVQAISGLFEDES